jgi:hypothetical protein
MSWFFKLEDYVNPIMISLISLISRLRDDYCRYGTDECKFESLDYNTDFRNLGPLICLKKILIRIKIIYA